MAETANIAEVANRISDDIFKWFKWKICGPRDTNWECVNEEHGKKTHPSDVVFHYIDPYSGNTVYINTDLKSYQKSSITKGSVTNALKTLLYLLNVQTFLKSWQENTLILQIILQSKDCYSFITMTMNTTKTFLKL